MQKLSAGISIGSWGYDADGTQFKSIDDMWAKVAEDWYQRGVKYWEGINADYNGVLGGYEFTHGIDVADNTNLIKRLFEQGMGNDRALGK